MQAFALILKALMHALSDTYRSFIVAVLENENGTKPDPSLRQRTLSVCSQ
jgi:hypothetical protein